MKRNAPKGKKTPVGKRPAKTARKTGMKCLVTGATGFLGTNLVHELVAQGWRVRAAGFPGSETRFLRKLDVELVFGDVTRPEDVDAQVKGCDVVFHVAGDTTFWKRNFARQWKINAQGPANVAEACLRHGVKRMVHTGTVDTIGYNPRGLADENWNDYNYAGTGYNYGDSKREGERIVREYNERGLETVIIHPGSMIGPFDYTLQFGRIFFDLRDGKYPGCPPGGGPFAHVRDVARAHIAAAHRGRPGQGYICAGVNVTYRELFEVMARKVDARCPRFDIPPRLFVLYGYLEEFIANFTGKHPEMNPGQARYMSVKAFYSSAKAEKELGYRITPLEAQIDDAFGWYRENGFLDVPG
jgi:dihydroflavonol-4-reductase